MLKKKRNTCTSLFGKSDRGVDKTNTAQSNVWSYNFFFILNIMTLKLSSEKTSTIYEKWVCIIYMMKWRSCKAQLLLFHYLDCSLLCFRDTNRTLGPLKHISKCAEEFLSIYFTRTTIKSQGKNNMQTDKCNEMLSKTKSFSIHSTCALQD